MDDTFTSSPSLTEDVVATFRALSRLAYFLASATLRFSTWAVTFATLTLPRVAYSVLSWGAVFTLQLNFTKVAITVGLGATILSYVWKVRYLNRSVRARAGRWSARGPDQGLTCRAVSLGTHT